MHDKIAKTFVVKTPGVERKGLVITGIILGFLIPILIIVFIFILIATAFAGVLKLI